MIKKLKEKKMKKRKVGTRIDSHIRVDTLINLQAAFVLVDSAPL